MSFDTQNIPMKANLPTLIGVLYEEDSVIKNPRIWTAARQVNVDARYRIQATLNSHSSTHLLELVGGNFDLTPRRATVL